MPFDSIDKENPIGMPDRRIAKKNKLKIRDARSEDRDAARKVTLSAFQQYAAVMPPPRWEGYLENILATLTDMAPAQQVVAEKEGIIVGSVLLYPPRELLSLLLMKALSHARRYAFWPSHQRPGVRESEPPSC